MCVVSMVGDHYRDKFLPWEDRLPRIPGYPPYLPERAPQRPDDIKRELDKMKDLGKTVVEKPITRAEYDKLREDVLEMKELLKRAVAYDKANGEPACETDEKVALLKRMADFVGVDLKEVFGG